MKVLLTLALLTASILSLRADIQDPPMNDYGPTRKLGRGISNLAFGITELPQTIAQINDREGNSAALSYGLVRGLGRVLFRTSMGVYEVATFPFTNNGTYQPPYLKNVPWIHGGYQEFPPELGYETRYKYVRSEGSY